MKISMIAALAKNNVIGYKNTLPWGSLPEDMKHFRELTLGKPVIMGKNTFLSLGKALKDRINIVLSDKDEKNEKDVVYVYSIKEALEETEKTKAEEVMIIGGAFVYSQFIDIADRLYITFIDGEFEGDTFFPEIDMTKWKEIETIEFEKDEKNKYDLKFIIYDKTE